MERHWDRKVVQSMKVHHHSQLLVPNTYQPIEILLAFPQYHFLSVLISLCHRITFSLLPFFSFITCSLAVTHVSYFVGLIESARLVVVWGKCIYVVSHLYCVGHTALCYLRYVFMVPDSPGHLHVPASKFLSYPSGFYLLCSSQNSHSIW